MAPKIARCSRGKCRRRQRPDGRYCALCHAAANRRSHRKHRKERNARRRDRAQNRDEVQRAHDSARAKLYVALARGTVRKGVCVVCQRHDGVAAYITEPHHWRDVIWACREHRTEAAIRTSGSAGHSPRNMAGAWADQRDAVAAAIARLSDEERERLYEIAARGPAGVRLSRDAPLFTMRLISAYATHHGEI